jgi:long-chain fatty acid transport protein
MTRLQGSQLMVGVQPIFTNIDADVKVASFGGGDGGNVGVLIEPRKGTRIGLTWIAKVDFDFKDGNIVRGAGPGLDAALRLSGLAGGDTELKWTLPQQVMLGVHHQLSDDLAIMGNLGWQDWSEFGEVGVSVDSTTSVSTTANANFQDTWHAALGARYRLDPRLVPVRRGGLRQLAGDQFRPQYHPGAGQAVSLCLGALYDWRKDLTLGVAF